MKRMTSGPALRLAWLLLAAGAAGMTACPSRTPVKPPPGEAAAASAVAALPSLADKLPADTLLYSRLDVARLLAEMRDSVLFVDEDLGRELLLQAGNAYRALVKLAANRGFAPLLFDRIFSARLHLAVLAQPEQEGKIAGAVGAGGQPDAPAAKPSSTGIWGEGYCMALIVESDPACAADFMQQLRAVRKELSEEADLAFQELEVDRGELVQLDERLFVGALEGYLVFTDRRPERLWSGLISPPAESLAQSPYHERYSREDPSWFVLLDVGRSVEELERVGRDKVSRAEQKSASSAESGFGGKIEVEIARSNLESFLFVKRLLSLDKLRVLGARLRSQRSPKLLRFVLDGGLHFDKPVSKALAALMDGGRRFQLSAASAEHGMAFLWRLGLFDIYTEVIERLDPEQLQQYQMAVGSLKSQIGVGVEDLLRLLSGDFYLFLDFEAETPEPRAAPEPRFVVQVGIHDRESTVRILAQVFETASSNPMAGAFMGRRSFQDREVYLFGPEAGHPDADPESGSFVAASVLTRHIGFGTWREVTSMIRREGAGEPPRGDAARLLAAEPDASLLLVASREVLERFETLTGEKNKTEELIREIEQAEMNTGDPETEARLKDALARMLKLTDRFSEQGKKLQSEPGALVGRHLGDRYELRIENVMRKP
ncbi:MAG: hypothetical protein JXR96_10560 [Deltaproteobacteria bacterium]|nr:hypothetical protein [Deltaproteobacteria bacterium]